MRCPKENIFARLKLKYFLPKEIGCWLGYWPGPEQAIPAPNFFGKIHFQRPVTASKKCWLMMMPSCSINCDTTFDKLPTDCTGSMTTETISFETIHLRPRSFETTTFETNSFQIYSFETNSFEITII